MAYTADVNRWRGPAEEPYRPHMLDTPWHPGWIAVTVLGFIIWWPIGLALLFFTLGSRKMACWSNQDRWSNKMERMQYKMERMSNRMERRGTSVSVRPRAATAPSTNTAWKRCGGWRKSRPNSAISSIGCATPRTRKSSTSSWRSIDRVRRRPRMASPRPNKPPGFRPRRVPHHLTATRPPVCDQQTGGFFRVGLEARFCYAGHLSPHFRQPKSPLVTVY